MSTNQRNDADWVRTAAVQADPLMTGTARRPSVALLHYTGSPVVGGVEAVMQAQARLLAGAGYPTTIVVGRGDGAELGETARLEIIAGMDSKLPAALQLAARPEGEPPTQEFLAWRDRLEQALAAALDGVDVVIVHNVLTTHYNLPLTDAIHRLVERGVVHRPIAWCHDISRYVNSASGAPQRLGYPWDLLRQYRPEFTYVAVSSRRQRALANVLGCPPDRIHVVPNGVDPSLLLGLSDASVRLADECGLSSADLVILMPIRITRAKNIEFALHVTAALRTTGLRVRLVITGPPDPHAPDRDAYYAELLALRQSLALEAEAVFIHERLPEQQLPLAAVGELYRIADLVLMPSLREGFGLPVLEAGLLGKPVFASAMPVIEDIGDGLVHLIQADETPQSVANRILAWAGQDRYLRLRRLTRQEYSWPAIFNRLIEPLIAWTVEATEGDAA